MIEILDTLKHHLEQIRYTNEQKMIRETDLTCIGPIAKKQGRILGIEDAIRELDKLAERMRDGEEIEDDLN